MDKQSSASFLTESCNKGILGIKDMLLCFACKVEGLERKVGYLEDANAGVQFLET